MTKREIASLAIKLMGVFILLKSVSTVPLAFIGPLSMGSSEESWLFRFFMLLMSLVAVVVPLAFSVLVIIFSEKAAAWLIKDDNAIENTNNSIHKGGIYFTPPAPICSTHCSMIKDYSKTPIEPEVSSSSVWATGCAGRDRSIQFVGQPQGIVPSGVR